MPTVARLDGLRVVIYPNDHRPAHVHVIGPDAEAVFDLHCPDGPPKVRENYGFALRQVGEIVEFLGEQIAKLCSEWKRMHGEP